MRIFNLTNGILTPAEPVRRCVDRSGHSPGLSFSHPAKQPARWRAIIPLGTKDFYHITEPCPTWASRDGTQCRFCGQTLQGEKCHGVVPKMPPEDTEYDLVGTQTSDTSILLAIKQKKEVPGSLILWNDNDMGDSVGYSVTGHAKILTYGHNLEAEVVPEGGEPSLPATITLFPVVLVSGKATLVSSGTYIEDVLTARDQNVVTSVYDFDERGQLISNQSHAESVAA